MAGASVVGVMAGGGAPRLDPAANASLMSSLTQEELGEMREYSKLLQFRDQIINGTHPRIKPPHLPGKAAQAQKPPSAPASSTPAVPPPSQLAAAKRAAVNSGRPVVDNLQSYQANQQRAQVAMPPTVPGLGTLSRASGKPEINPVLLEKSDDLIKAEIQLQRQRVERGLKEQLEQRRTANKASEQLAELDVADIMAKALSLVHATHPVQPTDDTAANASTSNDSADDDTFYSSRHDTPEPNVASRLPNESEDEEMKEGSPYEPELDLEPVVPAQAQPAPLPAQAELNRGGVQPRQLLSHPAPVETAPAAATSVPGLSIAASSSARSYQPQVAEASGAAQSSSGSFSEDSGGTRRAHDATRNERLLDQALAREPPVVRGHNLSPLAPQPTHVVQPAVARESQLVSSEQGGRPQAAPAQVTALRKQPSNGSSPESSPHGSRAEKKKNKKKKRKADRIAAEAAASPYIKPEPRSPSPLTPPYARPHKRQRYSQQQPLEIHDDEPRYDQPLRVEEGYQERYQPRIVRQERVVGYERADDYRPRDGEAPVLVTPPRYERVYYDDYRPPQPTGYQAGPESAQYVAREVRTVRPAPRLVEGPYEDGATYYRDIRAPSRVSVRPTAYAERSQSPVGYERPPAAAMPPPRAPPRRVIVDAFGREYLEPARPATVVREEVVAEPRGPYERVMAPRSISRRPEPLDDDAVIYHSSSPAYAAPRRVVTQPEYAYREQAGPGNNPMGHPPAEYLPSRPEPARDYMARPASVRPHRDPARYDADPPSYERLPLALDDRPPPPPRDFYRAASARPMAAAPEGAPTLARYEVPVAYERRLGPDDDPMQGYRSASVRPPARGGTSTVTNTAAAAVRYEAPPAPSAPREYEYADPARRVEYVPAASVPAPGPATDHASPAGYHPHHQYQQQHHHQQEVGGGRREAMAPPPAPLGRGFSVVSGGGGEVGQVGRGQQVMNEERYYGRAVPVHQQGREEEVVYLERGYR